MVQTTIFSFETNKEISLLTNIQVQINNFKKSLQKGTFNTDTITSLFDFEALRSKTNLTPFDIQEDIERLSALFQTEPEKITRLEGFTNTIIETNKSQNARSKVRGFNRTLQTEINKRNNLLDFL